MRNGNLTLKMNVTVQSKEHISLKLQLFNNASIDCFIKAFDLVHYVSRIKIFGPSDIICSKGNIRLYTDEYLRLPLKIEAKGHVDSKNFILSAPCNFHDALPGIYTIKYFSLIQVYPNENLPRHDQKMIGIQAETSFELE